MNQVFEGERKGIISPQIFVAPLNLQYIYAVFSIINKYYPQKLVRLVPLNAAGSHLWSCTLALAKATANFVSSGNDNPTASGGEFQ